MTTTIDHAVAAEHPDESSGCRRARRAAAFAMAAAPACLLAGSAVLPAVLGERHGDDRARSAAVLAELGPDRGRLPGGFLLVALGLALLVVAAVGLAWMARGSRLAMTGAAIVTIAAPMGGIANAVGAQVAYRLTDPAMPPTSAVDAFARDSGPGGVITILLYLLVVPGLVLLAIAAWRARAVAWWNAVLIAVGVVLGFAAPEGPTGVAFSIPLCIGMACAARRLATHDHR